MGVAGIVCAWTVVFFRCNTNCECRIKFKQLQGLGAGSNSNLRSNVFGRFSSILQTILYLCRDFSIRVNRSAILLMLSPLPSCFIFGYFLTSLPRRIKLWIWVLLYYRFRVFAAYSSIIKPHFLLFFKLNSLIFSRPNPKPIWPLKYFVSWVLNACSIFNQLKFLIPLLLLIYPFLRAINDRVLSNFLRPRNKPSDNLVCRQDLCCLSDDIFFLLRRKFHMALFLFDNFGCFILR